jgi:hypothetical protein
VAGGNGMSGTTLPAPQIDIEVSLAVGTIQPGGVWDSGTWDYNTWQETDTTLGDWTDVTCEVVNGLHLGAGSGPDGVVTRWEAQTCAFELYGEVWNPRTGPYVGLLGPGLPVRVRWKVTGQDDTAWVTCFTGFTDDAGFTYDPKTKRAKVAATDGTRIFVAYDGVEQSPIGLNETAAQRVTRIADMVGWPAGARDIQAGGVALQATTLAQSAWTLLLAVADTDLALLWLNRAGYLAYRPQGKVLPQRTVAAIIGCHVTPPSGTTAITPVNIHGQEPTITRNIVSISRQAKDSTDTPATATVRDEPSISRFLPHQYQRTDLLHTDDAWSTTVAEAVLMSSAWPSTAPDLVELSSQADLASSALLLGLEPSLSVQVTEDGTVWLCEPSGWEIDITRQEIKGSISLLDVTDWYGSAWDGADGWDIAKWGF